MMIAGCASLFALASCKKDTIIIPEANDPVFTASGTIGSEAFEIVAGDNDAYMYTMTQEENGVSVFSGRISDGDFALEMGIYDGYVDKPGHHAPSDLTNVTPVFARDAEGDVLLLSKSLLTTLDQSQYIEKIRWFVNGDAVGLNEAVITQPGKYEVCAEVTFLGGEIEQYCNDVIAGYELSANCSIDFSIQQGLLNAGIDAMGNPVEEVQWFIDDVFYQSVPLLSGVSIGQGFHRVTARVRFENGVERTKTVLLNGSNGLFAANDFTIFENMTPGNVIPRDFNIRLKIEKGGKSYTSLTAENASSNVVITNVEYYGPNDQGKDVYKITAVVSALVREVGTLKIVPVKFSTTFGLEIQ